MASTTAGSVTSQKQSASSRSCSQQHRNTESRRSCDTLCSTNSSCYLQRRKPIHPLATSVRTIGVKPGNVVKQRVLSAKVLKLKTVQSQLNDANFHLAELAKENKALRTLQKRQDKALRGYQDVDADLPRLIQSHEEEIRVLQEKNRTMKKNLREVIEQFKMKDEEANNLRNQLKHLMALTKDRHLGEREKLKAELDDAKEKLKENETQISLLNRKLTLEVKNYKYKLNNEVAKHKQCQKDLTRMMLEVDRLSGVLEPGDKKKMANNRKRFANVSQRQSLSCTSLGSGSTPELNNEVGSDESDVKFEPIIKEEGTSHILNGILKSPADNIKARLSSGNLSGTTDEISSNLSRINIEQGADKPKSIYTVSSQNMNDRPNFYKDRPNSSQKLESLTQTLQSSVQKAGTNEVGQQLGDYCISVANSVKTFSTVVDKHKKDFELSKVQTHNLLETLKQTDNLQGKLQQNKFLDAEIKLPSEDLEIVNKIWSEEYMFQSNNKVRGEKTKDQSLEKMTDKNGNESNRDYEVAQEEKKKLLAKLRAIDNGESVENVGKVGDTFDKKTKLLHELFGEE